MTTSLCPTAKLGHRRLRRLGAAAAITLTAGIVDVATLPPAPVEAAPVYWNAAPGADRISVIGDSVMAAIRWYGTWQPLRSYNYVVDVESCRRTTASSCRGREGYRPDTTLDAMRRLSGQLGSVLVVGTGYDDPGATFGSSIDAVMAEAARQGIPVVIWATMRTADVTYVGPTYASNASTFRDNNRILLGKAAQYGGRLQVADWATYSASRRDWVTRDGIHLTPSGATAMAQFIADQAAVALRRVSLPSAPTLYSEVVGANEVRLAWTTPASPGRSPIIDYGYEISPDGGATWIGAWAGPAWARSAVVGGLLEGGHYQFRLLARNSVGWGAYSNTISAKTRPLAPSAPTLYSEVVGANEVRLAWTEPTSTGGAAIIDYGYEISPDGGATWIGAWAGPAWARSAVVGGLLEGGHYQFRLLARNSVGWGAYSNTISAKTRPLAPSAPTLYSEVVGANEVRLAWTEPTSTGGAAIIDYGYEISPDGGATWIGAWAGPAWARSAVVGGLLEGGHYQFRLLARNSVGWGAYSNTISAMPGGSSDLAVLAAEDTITVETPSSAPEPTESTSDVTTEVPESSEPEVIVGDLVFVDADRDGVQDVDDPGLGGVEVRLVDDSGTVVDQDVSDSSGRYELAFPSSGSYSLDVVVPAGYEPTLVDIGPDDAVDSDVDPADVQIGPVETTVRIDLDAANVARLDIDVDIGLVTVQEEPPAASTTTTAALPTTTEPPTTAPPTTATPTTVTPTTAAPPPTAAPPTEPTTTETSATASVPPG